VADDFTSIHIAEYNCLRSEAMHHFTFANALIGLEVTAIGLGVATADKAPAIFACFSALTVIVWLSYMDHIASIHRIALYIGTILRTSIQDTTNTAALRWEHWLRNLRSSGVTASHSGRNVVERGGEPRLGLTYPSIFYGGTAATFLGCFVYKMSADHGGIQLWIWITSGFIGLLLAFAILQARRLGELIKEIDSFLLASENEVNVQGTPEITDS
jgi:hypothetical protein